MRTLRLKVAQIGSGLVAVALLACGGNGSEEPGSLSGGSAGTGATASGGSGGVAGGGGAGGSSAGNCVEFQPAPRVTACREFVGTNRPGFTEVLQLDGPVVTTTAPSTDLNCHQLYDSNGVGVAPAGSFDFQISDDTGALWRFSVYVPDLENPLANGNVISVTSSVTSGGYIGAKNVNLTVRDASGSLLFYVADVADTSSLTLPDGFSVSLADAVCDGESSCGSWSHYPFVVQGAGSSVDVPYLGSATLGEYLIQHAGAERQTSSGIKCWDWTVAHVALGMRPLD